MSKYKFAWMEPPEPIAPEAIRKVYEADVVIVGAGHSGSAAARAAVEGGASVIVLEKQKNDEKQVIFGNEVGTINSKFARARGVQEYDPLDFLTDWQNRTQNRSNANLIRRYAEHSGEALDWFLEPLPQDCIDGLRIFMNPTLPHYTPEINGFRNFIGTTLFYDPEYKLSRAVKIGQEKTKNLGGQFFFGYTGEQLVKDGDRVIGVIAKDQDGNYFQFNGRKAVVLSAGGCTANNEMVHDLYEELDEVFGHEANLRGMGVDDGSGIQMAIWAGAHMQPAPRAAMAPSISFMAGQFSGTAFLRLNRLGKRYTNEGYMGAFGGGLATFRQPKGFVTSVFDSNWREELEWQAPDHTNIDTNWTELMARLDEDMENVVAHGIEGAAIHSTTNMQDAGQPPRGEPIICAQTLEELGTALGYEGETLEAFLASIERYNELCDLGKDLDFGKDARQMHPIRKAPFFGTRRNVPIPLGPMATMSGVVIDEQQRVIGDDGDPIPGLYATGNNSGERFAIQYSTPVAGVSIGMALTFGKLLGDDLAKL